VVTPSACEKSPDQRKQPEKLYSPIRKVIEMCYQTTNLAQQTAEIQNCEKLGPQIAGFIRNYEKPEILMTSY
jgi:hypothetical protein